MQLDVNPSEKCDCQVLLNNLFSECCQQAGGYVASNWQGDGGHAFFPARMKSGNSIIAAQDFISKLSLLAEQTSTTLGRRFPVDLTRRRFRIKAHFGNVFLGANAGTDSGESSDFDSFLKHERHLAPIPDEFFITDQLRAQLGGAEKRLFELYEEEKTYGALRTRLHRMRSEPREHSRKLLAIEGAPKDLTESEWRFLRSHILSQKLNVTARNSITVGLIKHAESSSKISRDVLVRLTLSALYNYLRLVYPYYNFRLALWRPAATLNELEKVATYPDTAAVGRRIDARDIRFQVVRAFRTASPVLTRCVNEARIAEDWFDFDDDQAKPDRGLHSAIDLPVYRTLNQVGDFIDKETMAVLSIDTNKPDFFLKEELDMWVEDFVGFLANLALAERLA